MDHKQINTARAIFYGLFASVLTFFETDENFKNIQHTVDVLSKNPLDANTEEALLAMKNILDTQGYEGLKNEANLVFYSPSTVDIPMSASFYCEARDDGKKRQEMIELVNLSTFRRNSDKYKENEDNVAFIFNFMHHLIQNTIDGNVDSEKIARGVFERVLNLFVDDFALNVYNHENSDFYKNMAIILKVFIEYERKLYSLSPLKNTSIKSTQKHFANKEKVAPQQKPKKNFEEFKTL